MIVLFSYVEEGDVAIGIKNNRPAGSPFLLRNAIRNVAIDITITNGF